MVQLWWWFIPLMKTGFIFMVSAAALLYIFDDFLAKTDNKIAMVQNTVVTLAAVLMIPFICAVLVAAFWMLLNLYLWIF